MNNVPSLDLGESLHGFKVFTANFTPALRGDAIGNFDFVKDVHNSFARYVKILNLSDCVMVSVAHIESLQLCS